jgi:nascent polypeptide-associated complex subunit alpha
MGQETFQVVGTPVVRALEEDLQIPEDDIKTVMDQTGVSAEEAEEALKGSKGDIAQAIMELKKEE